MHHSCKTFLPPILIVSLIPLLSSCTTISKSSYQEDIFALKVTPSTASITSNDRSLVTISIGKLGTFVQGSEKDCYARIEYGNGEPDDILVLNMFFTEVKKSFKKPGTYSIVVRGDKSKGINACKGEAMATLVVEETEADVMNNMGFAYALGGGVPQSDIEAVKWYRKAASKGHAMATYNLGFMYEHGRGVEQNLTEAFKLYQSAAKKGSYEAMRSLGQMYADGRGVTQDRITGYAWATLAEERATATQDKVESLQLVDQIGVTLSSKEITSAMKVSNKLSRMVAKEEKQARRTVKR
jgi:hypothetical protein